MECPITFHERVGTSKGGNTSNLRALKSRRSYDDRHHFRLEMARTVKKGYHQTRLSFDPRRDACLEKFVMFFT